MIDPDHLQDLFSSVGPVTVRKMFGGQGIYCPAGIFALVINQDEICLKGDAVCAPEYEALGMARWAYVTEKTGKTAHMPYWHIPEDALDDPDLMAQLARKAVSAALRAQAGEKPKRRKSKSI